MAENERDGSPRAGWMRSPGQNTAGNARTNQQSSQFSAPQISLPKGGGAIRGIGEKFTANPATGTASLTVPLAVSPGRSGFGPQLSLSYDSGAGNGPFGFGWNLSLPSITRKTDKGLPRYWDSAESDVFMLSGAEDLVPMLRWDSGRGWIPDEFERDGYQVKRYRPRIEGLFARIERWTHIGTGDIHWRSLSKVNILTVYGLDPASRIADPENAQHIFSWRICQSYDDRGNAIVYDYAPENDEDVDLDHPSERNRVRSANRYLKRVRYGNRRPLLLDVEVSSFRRSHLSEHDLDAANWMFDVVFDYGDEDYREAPGDEVGQTFVEVSSSSHHLWPVRLDPFSTYRSGFEVRTYRLCRSVLMFHRFPEELGPDPYLVRSTDFVYQEKPLGSFLVSVSTSGYRRHGEGRYLKRSIPPVDFTYSASPLEQPPEEAYELVELETPDTHLPAGIDGTQYRWLDLDGVGISSVLSEQADTWFYRPNLGDGRFGPAEVVPSRPSLAALNTGRQELLDLGGDGNLDLVEFGAPTPGFQERRVDSSWGLFRAFPHLPVRDWTDSNLRFVDLTGDGLADVLISGDDGFTWHPSQRYEGFGRPVTVPFPETEQQGPRVMFGDGTQSIYLADMSGDGLSDIVRIRQGEVCYWPNQGYGRFGAKITMGNAPWFDDSDLFDEKRIRLADTDGSGPTDLIYLGRDGVRIYLNESGNRWSDARELPQFPLTDELTSVSVVDFLGHGTACLLWSSSLPSTTPRPLRYVDLMRGQKPHLLTHVRNNLGAETVIEYGTSTEFYLADQIRGRPWIVRLPFPVHVVTCVETYDFIGRNRFVTRYTYHHGYFDGPEREFRGFGLVEQLDTEDLGALTQSGAFPTGHNVDPVSHLPSVLTKIWFHTGAYLAHDRVSRQYEHEYYHEPGLDAEQRQTMELDDTLLPDGLSPEEVREACRALKGSMLRQEVYALDGKEESSRPYTVTESNYTMRRLQPRLDNRHAAFLTHARETVSLNYERSLYRVAGARRADPRVTHTVALAVDDYGNITKAASIGYGRRFPAHFSILSHEDRATQGRSILALTEHDYTHAVQDLDAYHTPLIAETRSYELTGLCPDVHQPCVTNLFRFGELAEKVERVSDGHHDLPYEEGGVRDGSRRRLIARSRTRYRSNRLDRLLPLRALESLALAGEGHTLAFTPGLLTEVYRRPQPGRPPEDLLPDAPTVMSEAGYLDLDGDGHWWAPSGRVYYSPSSEDGPIEELREAAQHFFLARRFRDPFDNASTTGYDAYDLGLMEIRDFAGNIVQARTDYRVLAPRLLIDPNGNRSEVAFDALGLVVGTAVMGKRGEHQGDSLEGFVADLDESATLDRLRHPLADPYAILQRATTRLVYDFFAFQRTAGDEQPEPAVVYTLRRETHQSDLAEGQRTKVQHAFSYSDGFGREIQRKAQAEPGPMAGGGPTIDPRWAGSGWTIFNNKGKPVRQYEPFFTRTHRFEFAYIAGVSPTLFYDPVERVVATLHPNHAYEKVIFDPWCQERWDVNDTVLQADPTADPDVGDLFQRLPADDYLPTWYQQRSTGGLGPDEEIAAAKTAVHADTPAVSYFDSLGRPFLTIAHNRFKFSNVPRGDPPIEEFYHTRSVLDIKGNQRDVIDARNRIIVRYTYDVSGSRIHQASMEAGVRWTLTDVTGKPVRVWDSHGHNFRMAYDALRRPTETFLADDAGAELLVSRIIYGETRPYPEAGNLRGKVVQRFDQAGVVTSGGYDFKGNLLRSRLQLAQSYKTTLDWGADVPLAAETFTGCTRYDALNRQTQVVAPHSEQAGTAVNVIEPMYNEANLLEQVHAWLNQSAEPSGWLDPAAANLHAVTNIDYDAKGQRSRIDYGNGASTFYDYDPLTFRLVHLLTRRAAAVFPDDCPHAQDGWPGCQVQNLSYTYDPAGNITHIRDDARQTIFFRNQRVEPGADYTYDAIYRLIEAAGREHLSRVSSIPVPSSYDDGPRIGLPHPGNGNAMGRYLERYKYDAAGNFLHVQHHGSDPANPGWTRSYAYDETSLLEPGKRSNRLSSATIGNSNPITERYGYDAHGNMLRMPHLQVMQWDFMDQLQMTQRQALNADDTDGAQHRGECTWYVYDLSGQRVRKVTERASGGKRHERIYAGGFELYREYGGDSEVSLQRETLHVMDDRQRLALVETKTVDEEAEVQTLPEMAIRYQLANHLDSSVLELDDSARIISYEEYYPYGSTSYQAGRNAAEVSMKRYRYTGKERDRENGLYYHGARYYAPWIGRWVTTDPIGIQSGPNLYAYCHNNCIVFNDPNGTDPPPDAVSKTVQRGDTFVNTEVIHREGMYSALVTTFDYTHVFPSVSQRLYRRDDRLNPSWTDVTSQALNSSYLNPEGTEAGVLSVEWNMPPFKPRSPEGPTAGGMVGEMIMTDVPPSLIIPYVKDSILADYYEMSPPGVNPVQHWADVVARRWAATGERKTNYYFSKLVEATGAGVSAFGELNSIAAGTRALGELGTVSGRTVRTFEGMPPGALEGDAGYTPNPRIRPHGEQPSPRPSGMQSHHPEQQTALSRNIANYDPDLDPALLMSTPQHRLTFGPQAAQRSRGIGFARELGTPEALAQAAVTMVQAGESAATAGQTALEHIGYMFGITPLARVLGLLP